MASQYESEKVEIIWKEKWLNGLQMVQFECPRHWKPSVSFSFEVGRIHFSHYWLSGVIRIAPQCESGKGEKFSGQNWMNELQMV